jgi:transposase InsO family protein
MARATQKSMERKREEEALIRYRLVSEVLSREFAGAVRAEAVKAVADRDHMDRDGRRRRVSVRTLYRWLARYDAEKALESLAPVSRPLVETSVVLPDSFIKFINEEKRLDPRASVPELIRRAEISKVIDPACGVSRVTAWRACKRMGLPTRMKPQKNEGDMRRFAYPHRMMMCMCDGKHFRAGVSRKRRVALFFLDDATRRGLDVIVGTDENTTLFLRGFYDMTLECGFSNVVYLDGGPGFVSGDTRRVMAKLPHVHLIHGTESYPEGRGKIERFNRTAADAVLRSLDGAAEVDADLEALRLRLRHFLFEQYNNRPHESLGGQTPNERWNADERALRFPEDKASLREGFVLTESRKVTKDHVISYEGQKYEVPRGLSRQWVDVRRQVLTGELSLLHEGRIVRLQPLNLEDNAKNKRTFRKENDEPVRGDAVPKTAATMAFERDFQPMVSPIGDFVSKK